MLPEMSDSLEVVAFVHTTTVVGSISPNSVFFSRFSAEG